MMRSLILALAIAAVACAPSPAAPPARDGAPAAGGGSTAAAPAAAASSAPAERKPVKISIPSPSVGFAYLDVAKETGLFTKHGLEPEIVVLGGNAAIVAAQTGETDLIAGTGTAARAAIRGLDVRVIQIAINRAGHFVMVGDRSITEVAQLRGKVIGGSGAGTTTNALITEFMGRRGIEPNQYEVVNVAQSPARALLLTNGHASAVVVEASMALSLIKQGFRVLTTGSEVETPNSGFAASQEALRTKRDLLRQASATLLEAVDFIRTQREQTIPILAKAHELTPEDAAQIYDWMLPGWTLDGKPSPAAIEFEFEQERQALELAEPIPVDRVYDFSVLDELRARR
jgi:NitT/TauT family transport system substrate-binding protein